jgi:hypothetical protein
MDDDYVRLKELGLKKVSLYSVLVFAGVILVIVGIHLFWPVKTPDTSSLKVLLDSVANDINAEAGAFAKAHLRIKEATIEVNLAAELSRSEGAGSKNGTANEVHIEAAGKGSSSHKLVVVLEREPDQQEAKKDAASSIKAKSPDKR